jgi:hypothetical protein
VESLKVIDATQFGYFATNIPQTGHFACAGGVRGVFCSACAEQTISRQPNKIIKKVLFTDISSFVNGYPI